MPSYLWRDQIYEALLDDEAMGELPEVLARTYGARSCVLHWWHPDGEAEIVSHNGYYSDDDMATYAENFTDTDLWSIRGAKAMNEVQNCDELVSPAEYERSIFYNEWIRGMGDDTFHCLGACVRTGWGTGFVGLHRGRTQGSFDEPTERALSRDIVDLRRMLSIRGRLARAERRAQEARDVVGELGDALITLFGDGRIVHINPAAERLLRREDGLMLCDRHLSATSPRSQNGLAAAIAAAADGEAAIAVALPIPRQEGRPLDLTLVPIPVSQGPRHVLLTVRDPEASDASLPDRLRQLYALSRTETQTAILLAKGLAPADIAELRGTSPGTVRSQIKSLAAKMDCHRQIEIAIVVNGLTRLWSVESDRR